MAQGILVKVHEYHRMIVAICDAELLGKTFEEGERQIEVNKDFYEGRTVSESELDDLLEDYVREDATFNIVGERSVAAALHAGIIGEQGVIHIGAIPIALRLM